MFVHVLHTRLMQCCVLVMCTAAQLSAATTELKLATAHVQEAQAVTGVLGGAS